MTLGAHPNSTKTTPMDMQLAYFEALIDGFLTIFGSLGLDYSWTSYSRVNFHSVIISDFRLPPEHNKNKSHGSVTGGV